MFEYILHLSVLGGMYVLLAASLNIPVGLSGQVSLGHGAFFGIGAYVSALLALNVTILPFPALLVLAGLGSAAVAAVLSPPALKLKDEYLAVVTLGFGLIFELSLKNLEWTGGTDGLYGLPNFGLRGAQMFWWVWGAVALCLFVTARLRHGQSGRNLTAIKESEQTAQTLGIAPLPLKVGCFTLSAFFAGLAGSLYAHYITFIAPGVFGLHTSILLLCMVVLGGMGTVIGPVAGGLLLFLLPEILQQFADYQDLAYGALLILILIFRPQGLFGRAPGNAPKIGSLLRKANVLSKTTEP